MNRIPVAGPWITAHEVEYVADAAANAWYENAGAYNRRFEEAFATYVGRRYAMAMPSCTSALHTSLAALNIGPGDEVIVPECTWIATAAPVSYVGATPVFADIDPTTWCLTPRSVERCLTPRTRAVIAVDLYGSMPDYAPLQELATERGFALIEDAAEALGSEYHGRAAGSFGTASAFSFHGSKTLTTGEGGMLVTDDPEFYERCQILVDHGRLPGDTFFFNQEVGFKYKMSSLQAALGLAQLERIEELVGRKREIFSWYQKRLADDPRLTLNAEPSGTQNSYWMVTVLVEAGLGIDKRQLVEDLAAAGIDSRPFFHPLSSLPAYAATQSAAVAQDLNPVAYAVAPIGINLPSALNLTPELVGRVCDTLQSVLDRSYAVTEAAVARR